MHKQIHMEGMIYDSARQCGVKRKSIPNPRIVDFSQSASYTEVLTQSREIFFPENEYSLSHFCLAGASGLPYDVDEEDWVLKDFIKSHGFQPSKFRLYLLFSAEVEKKFRYKY